MEEKKTRAVQLKILDIVKYIDELCREKGIKYFIMGGTALGAVRHGGFIPWDDDLDIFMTTDQYQLFKTAFNNKKDIKYVIQEWNSVPEYLEYAKVRMNGTTFIEEAYKDRLDLHQGIYVDIMILHKVPNNRLIQKLVYAESKFVTLYGLSQRNWKPKSLVQAVALKLVKAAPSDKISKAFYKRIYKYDELRNGYKYCYWITKANFRGGIFDSGYFEEPTEVLFEGVMLYAPMHINEYLTQRYGNFMKIPSIEQQKSSLHAYICDPNEDYSYYMQQRER